MDDTAVKWATNKTFVFHPILMRLGEVVVHMATAGTILQLHRVSSKSDEKQKSFINSLFNGCVIH